MLIRKLKLAGFKSFVEPAELRIEPGLTGVVGPNGCGKSNLLEAIRWVMGENSPKSMRSGGMDDVIFAGTAQRPPRDFAEVVLDATDDDGEELQVTRRIERGAGSGYRVNGRDVRLKDVALVFADAATGAHSPALVSQGKIAAVIAAKPAERRMRTIRDSISVPSKGILKSLRQERGVGWGVLLANCLAQALITVGVLASLYAGYLNPEFRVTASQLSAIINGFATILLFALIDPQLSVMTDDVVEGRVSEPLFRRTIVWISFSRLAGTVLAQLLFVPSALAIAWVANFV